MIKKYYLLFLKGWKSFYENINQVVSFVLLTFVYIFGVGISSIIVKIFKIRLAEVSDDNNTYWSNNKKSNKDNYFKQF